MQLDSWQTPAKCRFELADAIHVWRLPLDIEPYESAHFKAILSGDEIERANRFHFERDRRRYILVRSHLRYLLGRYLNIPPTEIIFTYNEFGKPQLASGAMHFNVSHSANFGLLAFDHLNPLGVDVEFKRPDFGGLKIARRFFSEHEVKELESLPETERLQGFFNGWSRKESYIKAEGKGLAIPLSQFSVNLTPGADSVLLSTEHAPDNQYIYNLYQIDVHRDYAGALTCRKSANHIQLFTLEDSYLF